jgi:uncharacterized YccA/Bax inhibitor family protein
MFIAKFITYIKLIITEFITNIHFIMQSTTPFIAIAFVLLLAAIIYVAIKWPAKLHSIGTVTIVFGLLCFSVAFVSVYDCLQRYFPDCGYQAFAWEKMMSGEIITREDFYSVESIWKYLVSPLAGALSILFWSILDYMIARILYIIRTPRI